MTFSQLIGGFKRVRWLDPSVLALLFANLVPLVCVFVLHWDVFSLLFLFWMENVIVGIENVLKMGFAGTGGHNGLPKYGSLFLGAVKVFLIPFFCVHYGAFTLVHGIFILALFNPGAHHAFGAISLPLISQIIQENHLEWPFAALVVSHLISFGWDYMWKGEYHTANPLVLMNQPYKRVIVMHLTIIFGGFLMMALHSPESGLMFLVVLKTGMDLWGHQNEREKLAGEAAKAPPPDLPDSTAKPGPGMAPAALAMATAVLQNTRGTEPAVAALQERFALAQVMQSTNRKSPLGLLIGGVLVLMLMLGFVLFVGYEFFSPLLDLGHKRAMASAEVPQMRPVWLANLTNVSVPPTLAAGKFRSSDFLAAEAFYSDGKLTLRDRKSDDTNSLIIDLGVQPGALQGIHREFSTNDTANVPEIQMLWHENGNKKATTKSFDGGYALKLDFFWAKANKNRVPAQIYLCLPDEQKSCIAGTMVVNVKRPKEKTNAAAGK